MTFTGVSDIRIGNMVSEEFTALTGIKSITFEQPEPTEVDCYNGMTMFISNPPEVSFECKVDNLPDLVGRITQAHSKYIEDKWQMQGLTRDVFCGRHGKRKRLTTTMDVKPKFSTDESFTCTVSGMDVSTKVVHMPEHRRNRMIERAWVCSREKK